MGFKFFFVGYRIGGRETIDALLPFVNTSFNIKKYISKIKDGQSEANLPIIALTPNTDHVTSDSRAGEYGVLRVVDHSWASSTIHRIVLRLSKRLSIMTRQRLRKMKGGGKTLQSVQPLADGGQEALRIFPAIH